ncbi:MAG: hypothetical protein U1F30_13260 [Steroidobacteraceae bacterium]
MDQRGQFAVVGGRVQRVVVVARGLDQRRRQPPGLEQHGHAVLVADQHALRLQLRQVALWRRVQRVEQLAESARVDLQLQRDAQVVQQAGDEGIRGECVVVDARQRFGGHGRGEAVAHQLVQVDGRRLAVAAHRAIEAGGGGDAAHRIQAQQREGVLDGRHVARSPVERGIGHAQHAQRQPRLARQHLADLRGADAGIAQQREQPLRAVGAAADHPQRRGGPEDPGIQLRP